MIMNYYNFCTSTTETLDYLRPPVRRRGDFRNLSTKWELCPSCNGRGPVNNSQKGVNTRQPRVPVLDKGTSSTSLFLKKPTSGEVLERTTDRNYVYRRQTAALSYSNLQHSLNYTRPSQPPRHQAYRQQPIIRVTVIPNNNSNKTRKRRQPLKRVQSTVSNQENSIKANNVYVVVTDRQREKEKIFEIKATGSVELPNNQARHYRDANDVDLEENLKELIKSLNMDKKKKKGKKKADLVAEEHDSERFSDLSVLNDVLQGPFANTSRNRQENVLDCKCPLSGNQRISNEAKGSMRLSNEAPGNMRMSSDLQDLRSRVKIVGRIGLGQDDKYILDCNATVDDKPIEANIQGNFNGQQFGRNAKPDHPSSFERNLKSQKPEQLEHKSGKRGQRDFYMQADIGNHVGPISVEFCSVATQCVPPQNFNSICFSNIEKLHIMSNPSQTLHRNYNTDQNNTYSSDYESSSQTPQSCSSPLVIISVYPKQGTPEKGSVDETNQARTNKDLKSKPKPQEPSNGNLKPPKKGPGKQKADTDIKSEPRSPRSPKSPGSVTTKGSRSPSRNSRNSSGKSSPKPKIKKEGKQGQKSKAPKGSPITPGSSSSFNTKQIQKDKLNQTKGPKGVKPTSPSTSKPGPSKGQQNSQTAKNTQKQSTKKDVHEDPALTKKAIVDAYTKKVTAQIMNRKNDSNVAISIDGEHEFYDVMFHQGNRTTDLRIRKTMKNQASQKSYADEEPEVGSASLENFFYMTDGPRKRSISQTLLYGDPNAAAFEMIQSSSRLVARDSIELSHRREMSNGSRINLEFNSTNTNHSYDSIDNSADQEFFAPIKHFKGDDCPLPNPVERDKEIRRLLGVENRKSTSRHNRDALRSCIKDDSKSLRCFFKAGDTKVQSGLHQDTILNSYRVDCCCSSNEVTPSSETPDDQVDSAENAGIYPQIQNGSRQPVHQSPVYQQMIVNRNVNVYLQIEQFTKQKPITLTRAQYDKVKKVIEKAKINKQGLICKKCSSMYVGEVRKKTRKISCNEKNCDAKIHKQKQQSKKHRDKQQNFCFECLSNSSNAPRDSNNVARDSNNVPRYSKNKPSNSNNLPDKNSNEMQPRIKSTTKDKSSKNFCCECPSNSNNSARDSNNVPRDSNNIPSDSNNLPDKNYNEMQPRKKSSIKGMFSKRSCKLKYCQKCGKLQKVACCPKCGRLDLTSCSACHLRSCVVKTLELCHCSVDDGLESSTKVLFSKANDADKQPNLPEKNTKGNVHAVSSTEIHYTNISYVKHVTFSATKIEETMVEGINMIPEKRTESMHTIFKGRRRCPTPNLGTSALSLFSDYSDAQSYKEFEEKPRKPFLRRLMSCLVMHARPSQVRVTDKQKMKGRPTISSIDSYHISTSLGAIDLSSSIYDTSASFYSNHSIYPINSRQTIKRGFLSSVRGFLYRT